MWNKFFKSGDDNGGDKDNKNNNKQTPGNTNSGASSSNSDRINQQTNQGVFQVFIGGRASAQDAEMERKVSVAARFLGDGVQKVVMAAKGSGRQGSGQHGEWKSQLLSLLGGGDDDQESMFAGSESNIDILLENSTCERFVLRCVENELPPNLIHCLRLLRVLELQHATSQQQLGKGLVTASISTRATSKVSKLLCLLCSDPSVGEQLRPHLFGLLALSGASYPASGVHVAGAASSVIVAFSEQCLSTSLVWFLHDRKMIVHMTDDIKELCGMSAISSSASAASANLCLYGDAAEEAGLWVVALRTVINLVVFSCNHQCLELHNDFKSANGYHVLCYAIANSSGSHAKKLLELVTILACCKTDLNAEIGRSLNGADVQLDDDSIRTDHTKENSKLANNPDAFDIIEDLMVRSVPLLKKFDQECGGERPEITSEESLRELSTFSMRTALNVRFGGASTTKSGDFDLAMELLVTTLQMYSDHAKNYDIIEERHSILSYYLLAFPTFEDLSLKVLILKTLEYVLTGVAGTDAIKPLTVATEIFFALCKSLLKGANGIELDSEEEAKIYEDLLMDAEMMCSTIEKLLEFDSRVAPIMLDGGILSVKLSEVLDFVLQVTDSIAKQDPEMFEADNKIFCQPPEKTALDRVFSAICRVLKLVVSKSGSLISETYIAKEDLKGTTNLNVLLVIAITHLGEEAAAAALGVFEAKISMETHPDLIRSDMDFVMELLNHYAEMTGRLRGLEVFEANVQQRRGSQGGQTETQPTGFVHAYTIIREASIFQMLKTALDSSDLAQDTFRMAGGFEAIVRATCCLKEIVTGQESDNSSENTDNKSCPEAILKLLEISFGLINAATIKNAQKHGVLGKTNILTADITTNMFNDPPSRNRQHLNQQGFYFDYASAISKIGILRSDHDASRILDLALTFIDPNLKFQSGRQSQGKGKELKGQILQNPDATRLLMGIAACLPSTDSGISMSKSALDEMLRLCALDMVGSSLSQIASCGLCLSITNYREFGNILENRAHHLYSRFVLLLRRIAAFSMTYMDFVSMLRCVAGPLLLVDSKDTRIRLPVISSSVKTQLTQHVSKDERKSDAWQTRETDFCNRLETLSIIAERGDRIPRCEVGGDSLNTIAVYMHKTPIQDRLYTMAKEGRLKFLEVECLDAAALGKNGVSAAGTQAPSNSAERIWTPLASSGFTYSLWLRLNKSMNENQTGIISVLDISSPMSSPSQEYMSLWYDLKDQRFNILTSSSFRNDPTLFPVSELSQGVWHHIFLTYVPPKRSMLSKKAFVTMFIDGRPLKGEVKVEGVNIPPNGKVYIGVPNPTLAQSSYVKGALPRWDLGPTLMLSTVLSNQEATAMYTSGPDFQGVFWGDRPQRLSLAATGTAVFAMLAESGEPGSVAGALRRRDIPRLEAAGTVTRERGGVSSSFNQSPDSDSLASLNLLCNISPEMVLFGYRAAASRVRTLQARTVLLNVARINVLKEDVSTDAIVHGYDSVISPYCFADNVQWVGGPSILFPIVNAAQSSKSLALALRLVRESVHRHTPNLEMLQAGGGYKMLAVLLRQKKIIDQTVLDQCFAFAVNGFEPGVLEQQQPRDDKGQTSIMESWPNSDRWVFTDLDAMKYLLLNHQVWDMRSSGPELPLRLLSVLNGLVAQNSAHKAFNARRLHLLGIVQWTLDLLLEASELYTLGEIAAGNVKIQSDGDASGESAQGLDSNLSVSPVAITAFNHGWYCQAPSVETTSVGGDPDNPLLQGCKTLLRRVLTFMLTPGDLEAISQAAIYTVSITATGKSGGNSQSHTPVKQEDTQHYEDEKLLPGPVTRVYLLRLIEELVVDGVNEIVASGMQKKGEDGQPDPSVQPHAGGGASTGESYLTTTMMRGRKRGDGLEDPMHPKHQQAQAFLNAFAGVLTPVWFACLLEGCHEEASASAVLRLMILMLQSSPMFSLAFEEAGGFAPLVLSIPKFSTCPSITMSMLSQLLHAPILHLPCFGMLDSDQLCEIFDQERTSELVMQNSIQSGARGSSDPSCGIFALLAECLGRNIQLAPFDNELGQKARETNEAVLILLSHRHDCSPAFQNFCRTPDFLEPLAQALCLVHDEKLQRMQAQKDEHPADISDTFTPDFQQGAVKRMKRRGSLAEVPKNESATERFVGKPEEEAGSSGIGMVQLLRLVVSHAVLSGPFAAPLVSALFRSFPIHASPEQVEAFHLVLIEHCRSVVEDTLQRGDSVALANCIGVSSVLLDRLMAGFFTSEPVLEAVNIIISTLQALTASGNNSSRVHLGSNEKTMLTADAAHVARLTCLTALQRSRPIGPYDEGDEDLKIAVLEAIRINLPSLLFIPPTTVQIPRRQSIMPVSAPSAFPPPPANSKLYPLWQSASLTRCTSPNIQCTYPDLSVMEEPDRAFVVALMDEIHSLLFDPRDELKEDAVAIIVSLLQKRRTLMSEILIAEVQRGDRVETIDIMNRGGFGALLVAHEAASYAENISTVPRRTGASIGSKKYTTFFEWLERNQAQVEAVFGGIHIQATRLFPGLEMGAATPEDAIENEQKSMLLRLTSQDSSDRTILGGLARAELAQRCYDETAEKHLLWKRQGFDDLSSGGLKWKVLLRQLKGSCSIWEGGSRIDDESPFSTKRILSILMSRNTDDLVINEADEKKTAPTGLVTKWKLDLTEGYEKQRRRLLLPNYEWYGLYGLAEGDSDEEDEGDDEIANRDSAHRRVSELYSLGEALKEVDTSLLSQLKVRKRSIDADDDDDSYEGETEDETDVSAMSAGTGDGDIASDQKAGAEAGRALNEPTPTIPEDQAQTDKVPQGEEESDNDHNASSYDLITGLLNPGDFAEKAYNVQRCMGLEVVKALLLWCRGAIYIIDGFELLEGEGLEGKIEKVKKEQSTFYINLRSKKEKSGRSNIDQNKTNDVEQDDQDEVTYHHRSHRISFLELFSVFQRRYQLQDVALEFFDVNRTATLVSFNTFAEREEVLTKVLNSPLPNSIFNSSYGSSINYKKFMNNWKSKVITMWTSRKITNFELIMHMNSFAGRSYNDLTQYPVFPWIIADYESDELDLDDPKTFRDLSKTMGNQTEARAEQFRQKYREWEEAGEEPAHYGTHYSCAAYVLYYLMRLEPFSRLALRLQGGRFDVADRLFHNLGSSWRSASAENQQDVRELIPEFFYLPEFLKNTNGFDFGVTQTGKTIHDVTLPKWAKGSPERFIRLNRQALESDYVSKNLNQWIDLVFGFKQKGKEAVAALNVFPHYSYEGNIDIDSLDDPILRETAIQSAQNFGQTPKCIERKQFPQRTVVNILRDRNIDFGALTYISALTPPFCIVGAPQRVHIRPTMIDACKVGLLGQNDHSVGDLCLVKGQLIGVGRTCALIIPQKKYYRFGWPNNGVSVHVAVTSARHRELNKMLSIHDGMHRAPISAAKASLNGRWLVTGCIDSTVRVWRQDSQSIELCATLSGHEGGHITCIDVSTVFGTIVTGCSHGNVLMWDLRTLTFLRKLHHSFNEDDEKSSSPISLTPVVSVSINHKNGNVVSLVGSHLSLFDINANLLACIGPGREYPVQNRPTCAVSTDCPDWMEQGIVAITGHMSGDILMWGLDYDNNCWKLRHIMPEKPHNCSITALRVADDRQDVLLVGDKSGKMSVCKTLQLENLSQQDLAVVADELRMGVREQNFAYE